MAVHRRSLLLTRPGQVGTRAGAIRTHRGLLRESSDLDFYCDSGRQTSQEGECDNECTKTYGHGLSLRVLGVTLVLWATPSTVPPCRRCEHQAPACLGGVPVAVVPSGHTDAYAPANHCPVRRAQALSWYTISLMATRPPPAMYSCRVEECGRTDA